MEKAFGQFTFPFPINAQYNLAVCRPAEFTKILKRMDKEYQAIISHFILKLMKKIYLHYFQCDIFTSHCHIEPENKK